ncbi:response regulator [Photobacterium andalusiense]|uniref:Chemotaxis protein CheY n=1 Tax=Photobacterium andalusiense TaxID=2204296 RepID=A0A1Y6MJH0_9GAMM|nr:response regulator [Photobacterium andalusiense]SMY35930.1 Chemotaxis protein CheY [Photobacterium andalusiense]
MTQASRHTNIDWQHVKVLIIDDQLSSALLIQNILHSIKLTTVDIATCSNTALQCCRTTSYDLILIDFHLEPHINGSELLAAIRKSNSISSHCGVVFISGDRTPEVIVTSMTMDADSFLSKPLNIGMLKQRVVTVYQACLLRRPIYTAIENNNIPTAITLCRQLLQQQGHNLEIEILLIDLLIKQQQWSQAQQLLTLFNQHSHNHKLVLRQAQLTHLQGDTSAAISMLQTLIKQVPLFVDAYDELATLLQQQQQDDNAKVIAYKALLLTPTISHRSLLVAQLAVNTNDQSLFIKVGKTLVNHLPIIDDDWIVYLAQYTAQFEQLHSQQLSLQRQQQLIKQLKKLFQQASRCLSHNQKIHLMAFRHIALARFTATQQALTTKRRLLHGLKRYFGQMSQAPSVIMVDALPLLIHFGETRLIGEIYQILMTRTVLDPHSHYRMAQLRQNKFLVENVRLLVDQLATAKATITLDPQRAYCIYQTILRDYPYSTEAHLGRIASLLVQQQVNHLHITTSLQQLKKMPLPSPLLEWFRQLQFQYNDQHIISYDQLSPSSLSSAGLSDAP